MQQHRIISLASILVMLLIPVVGWFLVAQPQLEAAAAADQQRSATEAEIAAHQLVVAQLKIDSKNLPQLNGDLNDLRTSIPADADADGYIDGLAALARVAKVDVVGLTVSEAVAYTPAVPPVDPAAQATDAAADGETPEGETPVEPAPVAPVEPVPGIVTNQLITSENFVAIPVTVDVSGNASQILRFVDGLQASPRLFLVTSFETVQDVADPKTLTATVGGYIYAIPTGVEGKPRPVSTTVKQMDPIEDEDEDSETPDPGSTESPDPDPSGTPAP
jgi:Tfp pilus assembly protein PilO